MVDKLDRTTLLCIAETITSWGIDETIAVKILEQYRLIDVQHNPWLMMYGKYINFMECDDVYLNYLKGNPLDDSRKEAFIHWYFENYIEKTGEIYIFTSKFKEDLRKISKIKYIRFSEMIKEVDRYVTSMKYYNYERYIEKCILYLLDIGTNKLDKQLNFDCKLDQIQQDTIKMALEHKISIITGYPGTGKTEIIKNIIDNSMEQLLLTPTGIATSHVEKVTTHKAYTLHRYFHNNGGIPMLVPTFKGIHDLILEEYFQNTKYYDYVIIDEFSMVDIELMSIVLYILYDKHMKNGSKNVPSLILIGDHNQLPSIGPGQILKDMITFNKIPYMFLTKNYRQEEGSGIIETAISILNKKIPVFNTTDCIFIETHTRNICNIVLEVINKYDLNANDSVVITPQKTTDIGTINLNDLLQNHYNKTGKRLYKNKFIELRENDRIIQKNNNYKKNIFNGSIGIVRKIVSNKLSVEFDGNNITYDKKDILKEMSLCYSITAHKSQGSEFDNVILIVDILHMYMLNVNLIYTALTRAKKRCIIIGNKRALNIALTKEITKKSTLFSDFLKN